MANATAQITIRQSITLTAQLKRGSKTIEPVTVPTWTIDNPTLATLVPTEDGINCRVSANGSPGVANVTCSAQGTTVLSFVTEITIVSDLPDTLVVSASNPFQA